MKKTIALTLFVLAAALAAYAEICVVPYPAKAALVAAGVNAAPFE